MIYYVTSGRPSDGYEIAFARTSIHLSMMYARIGEYELEHVYDGQDWKRISHLYLGMRPNRLVFPRDCTELEFANCRKLLKEYGDIAEYETGEKIIINFENEREER